MGITTEISNAIALTFQSDEVIVTACCLPFLSRTIVVVEPDYWSRSKYMIITKLISRRKNVTALEIRFLICCCYGVTSKKFQFTSVGSGASNISAVAPFMDIYLLTCPPKQERQLLSYAAINKFLAFSVLRVTKACPEKSSLFSLSTPS